MKKYFLYSSILLSALFLGLNHAQAAIVGSSPVVTATSTCSYGLSCGLVAYWTMDGKDTPWTSSSAATALDKSGNALTGTLTNMTQSSSVAPGKVGQALIFDGVDDRVMVNDSDLLTFSTANTTDKPFTLSVWAKRKGTLNNASGGVFIAKTDVSAGSTPFEYGFYLNSTNKLGVTMFDNSGGNQINKISNSSYNQDEGVWTHYAVTYTGSGTHAGITLYRNGVAISATGASAGTYVAMENTSRSVILGSWFWTDGTNKAFFRGQMDDVRMYKRVLSASEINQLYNVGASTKQAASPQVTSTSTCSTSLSCGLVGYWTFDGKDMLNGVALDKSGNGRTGNLANIATSTFYTLGKIGQAGKFIASNSNYVDISSIASTVGSGSFTISAWVKLSSTHISTSAKKIIFALNDAPSTNDVRLCFMGSGSGGNCSGGTNGAICLDVYSGSADKNACSSQTSWLPGVWYHVVASLDMTGGGQKLYVNSVLAGSDANTSRGSTKSIVSYIGAEYNGPTQLALMDGIIDDVRIYNRALSATEVQQLYAFGTSTKQAASPQVTATSTCSYGLSCGLIGYWTFDGKDTPWTSATAGTTKDSASGNTGTLTNMSRSLTVIPGKIGQALNFDGSDDYVNLGTPSILEGKQVPITISGWFKQESSSPTTQPIYAAYRSTSGGNLFSMLRLDSGTLVYYTSQSSGSTFQSGGSFVPTRKKWHFFAVVISGSLASPSGRIYLDNSSQTISLAALDTANTTVPIYIGGDNAVSGERFNGAIDDIRVYNRALSATEISQLYNLGR